MISGISALAFRQLGDGSIEEWRHVEFGGQSHLRDNLVVQSQQSTGRLPMEDVIFRNQSKSVDHILEAGASLTKFVDQSAPCFRP